MRRRSFSPLSGSYGTLKPRVDSRFYNTVNQLCKALQDLLLFFGGALLGAGDVIAGLSLLTAKVALTVFSEEISYRKSYAITREVLEERLPQAREITYKFPTAHPVQLYVSARSSRRGLRATL